MKVASSKTISFPKFRWGIRAGEARELPKDKKTQEAILAHPSITKVTGKSGEKPETITSKED